LMVKHRPFHFPKGDKKTSTFITQASCHTLG
jgi:hypothetical protein